MSAQKKVITIKGEEVLISQCKKFNKLYYKIGNPEIKNSGDCYLIGDKYYREETKLIVFNHTINRYVHLDYTLIEGVVDVVNDELVLGYFTNSDSFSKVKEKNGNWYLIFNTNVFNNTKMYRERLSSGDYYHISKLFAYDFSKILTPQNGYKTSLPYDSKGILDNYLENYNANYNPEISSSIKNYAPILEDLTFGLEFETTKGFIPKRILNNYGLIPLRDGSISGIEYVTVPMSGEKGLQAVCDITKVLKERTEYDDKTCSLHLHLGNLPRTKEFILAFFKTGMMIQNEVFSMFPLYKKYNYRIKNKNYSAPLPTFEILSGLDRIITKDNIDQNFNTVYRYLSMGQSFESVGNSLDNVVSHPADPNGNQKWNIRPRYLIYNMIPLLFGNKQTIEFRIHTPTYEVNKIMPFILMNALVVNFVIKNQDNILSNPNFSNGFGLIDILRTQIYSYKSKVQNLDLLQDYMTDYVCIRKEAVEYQTIKGNILGTESDIKLGNQISWEKDVNYLKPKNNQYIARSRKTGKQYSKSFGIGISEQLKNSTLTLNPIPTDLSYLGSLSVDKPLKAVAAKTLSELKKQVAKSLSFEQELERISTFYNQDFETEVKAAIKANSDVKF